MRAVGPLEAPLGRIFVTNFHLAAPGACRNAGRKTLRCASLDKTVRRRAEHASMSHADRCDIVCRENETRIAVGFVTPGGRLGSTGARREPTLKFVFQARTTSDSVRRFDGERSAAFNQASWQFRDQGLSVRRAVGRDQYTHGHRLVRPRAHRCVSLLA